DNEDRELTAPAVFNCCTNVVALILLVGTAIPFCMWVYQANVNLRQMGVMGLEFTPGWAVGWFLIPLVNWYRPYSVLQELWKASDPTAAGESVVGWKRSANSPFILGWCISWAISGIIGLLTLRAGIARKSTLAALQFGAGSRLIADLF